MIFPFGLPIEISDATRDLYNFIEKLPAGSNVAINFCAYAGMYPDAQAATRAGLIQLFKKPLNIVLWHSSPDGPMLLDKELKYVNFGSRVYGQDYVFLPYVGGDEATVAAIAENIRGIFSADAKGTPLNDIPLLKNINKAEDFSLILTMANAGIADVAVIRQWTIPHGVPAGAFTISICYPDLIPYWKAGSEVGMTNGLRGGAEYELLVGSPGPGLKQTDVLSLCSLLYVALILIGNVDVLRRFTK
ncbi:hypothetical protein A3K78_01545 [Candidatus Bathyarchaeota archaeon RBG_13_52_12]|nr:MAG: hypothetical protein A3K78_01545 [Candidatus Bathyarchaeota archaeon RBG_13_52_12]